jgi:predicted O-linked N-acetylglucosamine transferase (SPINDLY family)
MNRRERRKRAKGTKAKGAAAAPRPDPGRLFNMAVDDLNAGRLGEAEAALRALAKGWPTFAEALDLLGVVFARTNRPLDAEAAMRHAVALKPEVAGFHNNLGNVLSSKGERAEAVECYERALALRPDDPQTLNNLGSALCGLARPEEAAAAYGRALKVRPDYPEALSNYGNVLIDLGRIAEAVRCNERALTLKPDYAVAHNNLGNGLRRLGRHEDAARSYERAIALDPSYADALCNLAETLKEQGLAGDALSHYRRAVAADPGHAGIHGNLLLALNSVEGLSREEVFAEHARWGERFSGRAPPAPHRNSREPERRLRVGYVSPDSRKHSVAYFIEPAIAARDPAAIEVFCYANVGQPDATTARLRAAADGWRDIRGLRDADAARLIREDQIDILVDLAGHTMDGRLPLFALKPAPVQATYLGYPNTAGLKAVDWRLTDAVADPEGAERFHVERLARLPGFLCYRPPADAPEPVPPPCQGNGFVTFGSCNNLAKLAPGVVALWAEILRRAPTARLFLKAKALADPGTRARVAQTFAAQGVDPARLAMAGWIVQGNHLAAYEGIDVALDTFPYNGTTTTCEALWMGVPVVTLMGDRHASRVGASLLGRLGLGDLVAATRAAYVERALALALDASELARRRAGLRALVARSPLCDAALLARSLEAVYRAMWRAWCGTG